jgi:periplasmic protein TonB
MSAAALSFRTPYFAWAYSPEDEKRFRRYLRNILTVVLLACLAFILMPRPKEVRVAQEAPPRLAKLLLEREALPIPKPAVPPPIAKKEDRIAEPTKQAEKTATPEPKRPEPRQEAAKGAKVPEARNPIEGKPPGEVDAARKRVAGIGLLASSKELNELRGAPVAVQLQTDIKQGPGVGTGVGVGVGAGNEAGIPIRSMITSNAQGGSGGGKGNGTGLGSGDGARNGGSIAKGGSGKASRSLEDIKIVLERSKGSLYSIYNRALREDASLQGKVVVELKIAPSGEVMSARVISSELKTPDLEAKILARIRTLDFGAKDVSEMVTTWPLDFLPA